MSRLTLPLAHRVTALHDRLLAEPVAPPGATPAADGARAGTAGASATAVATVAEAPLWQWIAHNHRCNRALWAEEDLARRTRVADAEIAANKRAIDGFNQSRNDATERVDEWLLTALGDGEVVAADAADDAGAASVAEPGHRSPPRLNSETAGSIVDRLSIVALKIDAMAAQTRRDDVDAAHREASAAKLARLREQRADLAQCLDELLADAVAGRARFKVYRQFKMYNDARLNPALVAEQRAAAPPARGDAGA